MLQELLKKYKIVLASKSPRRQALLKDMGLDFEIITKDTEESFPAQLSGHEIVLHLCKRKAEAFSADELPADFLLITADTIVIADDQVLNKAADKQEAIDMLTSLSDRKHQVITGVCLRDKLRLRAFYELTEVSFGPVSRNEMIWYVDNYKPFDKAGAYGIQEWIGLIGIESIKGSYFNVVGLPTFKLFHELKQFANEQDE
jgi:septum formation protein